MMYKEAGYIVMCAPKNDSGTGLFDPMAYGNMPDQPAIDMLLTKRGATIFATRDQAEAALKDTLTRAEAAGYAWPKTKQYRFVEVRHVPPNV